LSVTQLQIRKYLFTLLKITLTIGPLVWIYQKIDIKMLTDALTGFDGRLIPGIIALFILQMYFLQSFRWWLLLHAFLPGLSYSRILELHSRGIYYAILLPTTAAQDIVRALLLQKKEAAYDYRIIWGSTGITKLMGVLIQLLLGILGLCLLRTSLPRWVFSVVGIAGLILISTTALFFTKSFSRQIRLLLEKWFSKNRYLMILKNIREGIYLYRGKPTALMMATGASLIMNLCAIANACLIFKGITGHYYLRETLTFIPIIELMVISVPLTPGGIGVRELLLSFFLTMHLKLTSEQTAIFILFSFSANFLRFLGGLPIIWGLLKRWTHRASSAPDN
jgi:uncharacterized protein (TIRG00374 family)